MEVLETVAEHRILKEPKYGKYGRYSVFHKTFGLGAVHVEKLLESIFSQRLLVSSEIFNNTHTVVP